MNIRQIQTFLFVVAAAAFLTRPAAAQNEAANTHLHCLWRVDGASNTVYLIGSIHLLKSSDYPLPVPLETAYSNAQIAAFETDIDALEEPETQMKILSKVMLPGSETLESQLSPATWNAFTNAVTRSGFPMFMFTRFTPTMAAMTLEILEIQKLGVDPAYGVDKYFFPRAKTDGKQIVPLETVDFQIHLITDFSKEEGELLMKSSLKEIAETREKFGELIQCWKTGDAPKLASLLNDAMQESPPIFKRLVTDRNKSWIPKIQEFLAGNQNAVVIVGAGHLVGSEGVVELLRKKGFKVAQL